MLPAERCRRSLLLKLLLAPGLIGAATLAARRWGPGVGGWLVGLPLTSAPVSIFLALEQGPAFAARAAGGTLAGLAGVGVFCLAYGLAASRASWPLSTAVGLGAFVATLVVLGAAALPVAAAFGVTCGLLAAISLGLPRTVGRLRTGPRPWWDLPLRMAVAPAIIVSITTAARWLGPALSGLVSPIPVFALVLGAFTHRAEGPEAATDLLRGVVIGSFSFAAFFLVVGLALERLGLAPTYVLATLVAVVVNALALPFARSR
jgi:hypothetical protein